MKKIILSVSMFIFLLLVLASCSRAQTVLVEAEGFANRGGWHGSC